MGTSNRMAGERPKVEHDAEACGDDDQHHDYSRHLHAKAVRSKETRANSKTFRMASDKVSENSAIFWKQEEVDSKYMASPSFIRYLAHAKEVEGAEQEQESAEGPQPVVPLVEPHSPHQVHEPYLGHRGIGLTLRPYLKSSVQPQRSRSRRVARPD